MMLMASIRAFIFSTISEAAASNSGDAFVLQNPYYDASIRCLSFRGFVVTDLLALAHCSRSQDVGERNATMLQQKVGHIVSAVFAELLIQGGAAGRRRVTFYFDNESLD